jgi:hypothetical protein
VGNLGKMLKIKGNSLSVLPIFPPFYGEGAKEMLLSGLSFTPHLMLHPLLAVVHKVMKFD